VLPPMAARWAPQLAPLGSGSAAGVDDVDEGSSRKEGASHAQRASALPIDAYVVASDTAYMRAVEPAQLGTYNLFIKSYVHPCAVAVLARLHGHFTRPLPPHAHSAMCIHHCPLKRPVLALLQATAPSRAARGRQRQIIRVRRRGRLQGCRLGRCAHEDVHTDPCGAQLASHWLFSRRLSGLSRCTTRRTSRARRLSFVRPSHCRGIV
jgi:hypothetical protein